MWAHACAHNILAMAASTWHHTITVAARHAGVSASFSQYTALASEVTCSRTQGEMQGCCRLTRPFFIYTLAGTKVHAATLDTKQSSCSDARTQCMPCQQRSFKGGSAGAICELHFWRISSLTLPNLAHRKRHRSDIAGRNQGSCHLAVRQSISVAPACQLDEAF